MRRILSWLSCVLVLAVLPASAGAADAKGIDFFEKKVRPVLIEHCYPCHSEEARKEKKLRGGLLLDSAAGVRKGGASGPALVPGKPAESLILRALRHDGDLKMPPRGKLPAAVVADLERWVARGAPDPRDGKPVVVAKGIDITAARKRWAFRPLPAVKPPALKDGSRARNPVDRFLLAKLEEKGLTFAPPLAPERLLRRLNFDLTGLPP